MPALLTLEAIGPKGEDLAFRAGKAIGVPVGFDPESERATFDADSFDAQELQAAVFDALTQLDPEWQTQLRVAE